MSLNLGTLHAMVREGEKIAVLTCYDASFARLMDSAGVDVLLVGDSLGNVVQGESSTLPVTLDNMVYHATCVNRGVARSFVVVDMPFGSYQESPVQAFRNAAPLLAAGAQMVKIEGGMHMVDTVRFLVERGVPVCAHIGLTPQSVHQLGGYRVQGKKEEDAERLFESARALEDAGAGLIVLEAIPAVLAERISAQLAIPTIGIGAGAGCDGQVLVSYDMLGIYSGRKPRFVRDFLAEAGTVSGAISAYVRAVKDGSFPGPEHSY